MIEIPPHQLIGRSIKALTGNSWGIPVGSIGQIEDFSYGFVVVVWDEPEPFPWGTEYEDVFGCMFECASSDLKYIELIPLEAADCRSIDDLIDAKIVSGMEPLHDA